MIVIISPSKTLDFNPDSLTAYTQPRLLHHSLDLMTILKQQTPEQLASLMKISDKLSQLNWQRYQDFTPPFTLNNAKQALLAFKGDVYSGIDSEHYQTDDFAFAQQHLRILSGLYGLLRPLDLIQPYRLEMGTRLENPRGGNLYQFWNTVITDCLNEDLKNQITPVLINLASNEYFKAIKPTLLQGKIISIHFKENKAGGYKIIGIHAKKARGLMADFIIQNRLTDVTALHTFNKEDYQFNATLSSEQEWVFTR